MARSRSVSWEPRSSPRFLLAVIGTGALRTFFWVSLAVVAGLLPAPLGAMGTLLVGAAFMRYYRLWGASTKTLRALAEVRLRPIKARWAWFAGALAAFIVFDIGFMLLWHRLDPNPDRPSALDPEKISLLSVCLVSPMIEEVIFRGWMLRRLELVFTRSHAAVVTALAFAVLHFQLTGIPHRFFIGIIAALAVYATRSLWSAVVIHVAHNALAVANAKLEVGTRLGLDGRSGWLVIAVTLAVGLVGLAFATRDWRRHKRLSGRNIQVDQVTVRAPWQGDMARLDSGRRK